MNSGKNRTFKLAIPFDRIVRVVKYTDSAEKKIMRKGRFTNHTGKCE